MELTTANPFHPDKLLLHQGKVAALAHDQMIAPQTIEVDLTDGACNQACLHCCFSSGEGKKMVRIDRVALLQTLREAYALGTRAVELVGGGEPTAHPEIVGIISDIFEIGAGDMEVGIITNGLLAERLLPVAARMRFVRISLDTAVSATYQVLHGVPGRQFDKVLANIRRLREVMPLSDTARQLGVGYLVVPPHNHQNGEVMAGAELAHELNVDYITYRPVEADEEHPQDYWREAQHAIRNARRHLRKIGSRTATFGGVGNRWDTLRPGGHPTGICDAKPLVAVLQANGDIAHCILYRNQREMRIGNIHEGSFAEQWFSEAHRAAWRSRQVDGCPNPCKLYRYNEVVRDARANGVGDAPPHGAVAHHLFV